MRTLLVATLSVMCLLGGTAHAASFPCEKARSPTEKMICGNQEVSDLDEYMGRYYSAARSDLKQGGNCLAADQREWLRTQRDACKDADCLKQVYLKRLAELDPMQPGASALRNVELPRVKALVWIVPPAQDNVAAPVDKNAKPLVAQGTILNEVSGGDGYVLRTGDGKRHLIVPLMFLEGPTTERLEVLAKSKGAGYELRGHAEVGSDGSTHFAPSRCVFVYRTTP
jgi:uncharacterized protein